MSENFYNILGVNENASKDEIKKAYRSLQMKYHPDKNPGNQECINMTQKINEAYETLGDEQKRSEYDIMRKNPGNPFMRMSSHGPHNGGMEVPINDIFNMMFGGANPFGGMHGVPPGVHIFHGGPMNFQQAINKPVPIIKSIEINMEQVYTGVSLPLEIERWVLQNGVKTTEKETIYVDIPQGIDENEMIILRDKGNIINDQLKGDVKISIIIKNDTPFKRSGLDLIFEKTITLKESLCGFSFEISYINGKNYTINNNNKVTIIRPDYKKSYPNMGLKRGEHTGNMIILFHVQFPDDLTEDQVNGLRNIL